MARKYRVIAGACPGNTKVYSYNDIISGTDVDNADVRVRDGFLVEVEEEAPAAPAGEQNPAANNDGAPGAPAADAKVNNDGAPAAEGASATDYAAMTKAQLMDVLTAKGIAYTVKDTKEDLLAKLA
jgi:hypothetical protein